jgi:hypothetical protein
MGLWCVSIRPAVRRNSGTGAVPDVIGCLTDPAVTGNGGSMWWWFNYLLGGNNYDGCNGGMY